MTKLLDADAATPLGLKIIMAGFSKAALTVLIPAVAFVFAANALDLFRVDWAQSRADGYTKLDEPSDVLAGSAKPGSAKRVSGQSH